MHLILKVFIVFLFIFGLSLFSCQRQQNKEENIPDTKTIFHADFNNPKLSPPWQLTEKEDSVLLDERKDFVNGLIQFGSPNTLKSPKFDVAELTYYHLNFTAKTTEKTMWALVFFDGNGKPLLADIYSSIEASSSLQAHSFYFQSKHGAVQAQFWLQPNAENTRIEMANISIKQVDSDKEIIDWADSIYTSIPPIQQIAPPLDRAYFIPKTIKALASGEKIRIVMLGNSIINDTGNSAWEKVLKKSWPNADIEVITSVRGGTGCWYYQHENRVDDFVIRYQPDLLLIGGISHKKDTAAIHNVINQVRKEMNPEILVFTGPVGRGGDPRSNPDFKIPAEAGDYRLNLQKMAEEAKVGYWDMQTEWGNYIQSSGKSYDFYLRDPVHANARGRQVLARLMVSYFSPQE